MKTRKVDDASARGFAQACGYAAPFDGMVMGGGLVLVVSGGEWYLQGDGAPLKAALQDAEYWSSKK
jgi:hypothetical protein